MLFGVRNDVVMPLMFYIYYCNLRSLIWQFDGFFFLPLQLFSLSQGMYHVCMYLCMCCVYLIMFEFFFVYYFYMVNLLFAPLFLSSFVLKPPILPPCTPAVVLNSDHSARDQYNNIIDLDLSIHRYSLSKLPLYINFDLCMYQLIFVGLYYCVYCFT